MRFSTLAAEVRSENTYGLNMQFFSLAVSHLFATDRWRGFSGNYQYRYKQKISSGTQCSVSVYLWLCTTCLDVSSILSP